LLACLGLWSACGSGADLTEPSTGAIEVTVVADAADQRGPYLLALDGGEQRPIEAAVPTVLRNLLPGDHLLKLGGLPAACAIIGPNPLPVTVVVGGEVPATFEVTCVSPPRTASLAVRVVTTGTDLDPDGYALLVDPLPSRPVQLTDSTSFDDLAIGPHAVRLEGLAGNCEVRGENPLTIEVGAEAAVELPVSCWAVRRGRIAFVRKEFEFDRRVDVFLENVDGTSLVQLTRTPEIDEVELAWSPDGRTLAFVEENSTTFLLDRDDGSVQPIGEAAGPVWSPDGRKLLLSTPLGIQVLDLRTGRSSVVSRDTETDFANGAAWSPDGTFVAVGVSTGEGDPFIRVVELATSNTRIITPPHLMPDAPNALYTVLEWSRDGKKILVEASFADDELFLLDVASSAPAINLTNDRAGYFDVSFSPDGSTLLFVKIPRGGGFEESDIYTLQLDGLVLTKLSRTSAEYEASWSPDGSAVVYSQQNADAPFTGALWIVNTDGTGRRQVTGSPFVDELPRWAP
jgi:Tol biopolymer transport system component